LLPLLKASDAHKRPTGKVIHIVQAAGKVGYYHYYYHYYYYYYYHYC